MWCLQAREMTNDHVFSIGYDVITLKLEYKTTCDALEKWSGGDPEEQMFLEWKKNEVFRALCEISYAE